MHARSKPNANAGKRGDPGSLRRRACIQHGGHGWMRRRPCIQRGGAAAVEMAVTLPILILFFFAQFELVRLNNIRNSVYMAAYEGAREGLVPGATVSDIQAKVNNILGAVGAINATTTVSPTTITSSTPRVSVTVTVPLDSNAWTIPVFAPGKSLTATVELVREEDDTAYVAN